MEKLPQHNSPAEQRYFGEEEFSAAYVAAEQTHDKMKAALAELAWITGTMREKNSYGVSIRWLRLNSYFTFIRQYGDKYSSLMMQGIESHLANEIKGADKANVEYEPDENPGDYFYYYIRVYADTIIEALKKEMTDKERDIYELNYV